MAKKIYNKLVRDKIPAIITKTRKIGRYRKLNHKEYIAKLNEKLIEECNEWIESSEASEIADILEVIESIMKINNISSDEVNKIKEKKKLERGGFDDRILLIDVNDSVSCSLNSLEQFNCIGIDACKGKWVAVSISNSGFEVKKYNTIDEICDKYANCSNMLIDIPIGLRGSNEQVRPDSLVKKQLGKKGSSVFPVPCRAAIYETDKTKARIINIATLGKSLSEQSIGFSKAIRQVDEFLLNRPSWKNKLLESHPEFCFMLLNNGEPILEKKTTEEGIQQRIDVLSKYYPKAKDVVEAFLAEVPSRKKVDDVVDALSLAVMGKLILETGLKTIPENPMKDSEGIIMQIVYTS